jgi:dihydrofolate synthase/folylpolyglutamate synthase
MKLQTLRDAERYLFQFIPQDDHFKFVAELGINRTKRLASFLDNPQDKIKVIHIAGTSGKGSTAQFTQTLLKSHGFKTGLHISPHLVDIRERFQINGAMISESLYLTYLNKLTDVIEKMKETAEGTPTYFEIITVLAYYIFFREEVDYAVVETGLGGQYDATNIVMSENKLCILTRIGLDHTKVLGNTLSKIADQKVRIVQRKNTIITINQRPIAQAIIEKFVKEQKATLIVAKTNSQLQLHVEGEFQKENCSLAIKALSYLSKRDGFALDWSKVTQALLHIAIPGRFEIIERDKKIIIIDGAHNPQKMSAFTRSLKKKYPGNKFTFLLAFKRGKDIRKMIQYVIPLAKKIIITQFLVDTTYTKISLSQDPETIGEFLNKQKFSNFEIIKDSKEALKRGQFESNILVITGSLYLIGEMYTSLHT